MKRLWLGMLSAALLSAVAAPIASAQDQNDQGVYGPSEATEQYSPDTPEAGQDVQPGESINRDDSMMMDQESTDLDSNVQDRAPERLTYGPTSSQYSAANLRPFDVAYLAYFGYFNEQGIPGYGRLIYNYTHSDITGEDVVQAAVDSGRLSAEVLEDDVYAYNVDRILRIIHNQNVD